MNGVLGRTDEYKYVELDFENKRKSLDASSFVPIVEANWKGVWNIKNIDPSTPFGEELIALKERIIRHIAEYIFHFRGFRPSNSFNKLRPHPAIKPCVDLAATDLKKKWTNLNSLGLKKLDSPFSCSEDDVEMNSWQLGEGICVGLVLTYLSRFLKTRCPIDSIPFSAVFRCIEDTDCSVKFFTFFINDGKFEEETKSARFIQASHVLACVLKRTISLEYAPLSLLKNLHIKIVKRYPDANSKGTDRFACITELASKMKDLERDQPDGAQAYMLALYSPPDDNHALMLHLNEPYHFFDPTYGLGFGCGKDTFKNFALFLLHYLSEKYPRYEFFSLLTIKPYDCVDPIYKLFLHLTIHPT